MNNINIKSGSKQYKEKVIFKDIQLTLTSGKIYGLVGHNGSGKTVLLKCISGLEPLSDGQIFYNNLLLKKGIEFLPSLGLIIETPNFLEQFTGFKNLKLISLINRIITDQDIKETLNLVGLDPDSNMKVKHYSLGMKQKLAIAQAIMESPDVLLLDEPTNAIDKYSLPTIYELFFKLKEAGKIIVIASHNHAEIAKICDEIIDMAHLTAHLAV